MFAASFTATGSGSTSYSLAGESLPAANLTLTYVAAQSEFGLQGTTSFPISNTTIVLNLPSPGLVIQGGNLPA